MVVMFPKSIPLTHESKQNVTSVRFSRPPALERGGCACLRALTPTKDHADIFT